MGMDALGASAQFAACFPSTSPSSTSQEVLSPRFSFDRRVHHGISSRTGRNRQWDSPDLRRYSERHADEANTQLEKLTAELVSDLSSFSDGRIMTSASLRKLILRYPSRVLGSQVRLHAPNLRELEIEASLLCKLSVESLAGLSALHLTVKSGEQSHVDSPPAPLISGPTWMDGLRRIASFTGPMTLEFGTDDYPDRHSVDVLGSLASSEFAWPGLDLVDVVPQQRRDARTFIPSDCSAERWIPRRLLGAVHAYR